MTMDEKGRVAIPSKLRFLLGERIILVRGIDPCLYVFTPEQWAKFSEKYILNRSWKYETSRKLQRYILASAREIEIEPKQGRINLPQDHMEYAGIEKDVVFIGVNDFVEVWSSEAYDEEMDPKNMNLKELMSEAPEELGGD